MTGINRSLLRKRASRLAAVQALFADALLGIATPPAVQTAQMLESWALSRANGTADLPAHTPPEQALLTRLLDSARTHGPAIESAIDALILPQWSKSRTSLPLLSCLRAFAAECQLASAMSRARLIDEYTEVAAQLVTDEELAYAHKAFNLLADQLHA